MKKISSSLKAVIFDMDGVITNTMPDHFRAWHEVLRDEGIPVTHYDIYSREGQRGITSVKEIFALYRRPFQEEKAHAILKKKEELFKRIVKRRFIVGARSFLKALHKNKFQLALVTGTSRHELHRILPDAIYKLFSVVVTGSDVKNGKPHPEPYRRALRELGLKPREAVVVENAPFGIQAAKAAGLTCFALETSLPRKHLLDADHIFPSIRQLRKSIARYSRHQN